MLQKFLQMIDDESGATAIEYGLLAGLISVALISAVGLVGTTISGKFDAVYNALK